MPHNPAAVPDNPPTLPTELLATPAERIFRLLAAGVSPSRVAAVGVHGGMWTADDVQVVVLRYFAPPSVKRPPTPHRDCGTRKGYHRHYRDGESACRPCTDAHTAYNRDYQRRGLVA